MKVQKIKERTKVIDEELDRPWAISMEVHKSKSGRERGFESVTCSKRREPTY